MFDLIGGLIMEKSEDTDDIFLDLIAIILLQSIIDEEES